LYETTNISIKFVDFRLRNMASSIANKYPTLIRLLVLFIDIVDSFSQVFKERLDIEKLGRTISSTENIVDYFRNWGLFSIPHYCLLNSHKLFHKLIPIQFLFIKFFVLLYQYFKETIECFFYLINLILS
jgi:hypothetical protein